MGQKVRMAKEIERKFLVANAGWKSCVARTQEIRQAYLTISKRLTVRVRVVDEARAVLTIKTALNDWVRDEFEYAVPLADAEEMFAHHIAQVIHKRRNLVPAGPYTWEIDEFKGIHSGLVLAEIELPHVDATFSKPEWIGRKVTGDPHYYNSALARSYLTLNSECHHPIIDVDIGPDGRALCRFQP